MTDASDHQKFIDALRLAREQESCMESQIFQGIDVSLRMQLCSNFEG